MQVPNGTYPLSYPIGMFVILIESLFANGIYYCEGLHSAVQVALFCHDFENTQVSFISNNDNIFDRLGLCKLIFNNWSIE